MLERLLVPAAAPLDPGSLAAAFPGLSVVLDDAAPAALTLGVDDWSRWRFDGWAFDVALRRLADAGPFALRLAGGAAEVAAVAAEVLLRCQRLLDRRNPASTGPGFDRLLAAHRALHDLDRPLVRADFEHALDTWQWTLRLDPEATLAAQAAALFHDVERLFSEARRRTEHRARDYRAFKDRHARAGAALAQVIVLAALGDPAVTRRAAALVEGHERPGDDAEARLLAEADALSFFSLNSDGFFAYFGPAHTQKKVAHALGRLGPRGRDRLHHVHCRPEVEAILAAALGQTGPGGAEPFRATGGG